VRIVVNPLQVEVEQVGEVIEALGYEVLKVTREVRELKRTIPVILPLVLVLYIYVVTLS